MRKFFPPALCAIINTETLKLPVLNYLEWLLKAGATFIQLRAKNISTDEYTSLARACVKLITQTQPNTTFIINDNPEIALRAGASGVHLGQDDMPVTEARRVLGDDYIIGLSTHNTKEIIAAYNQDLDYFGLGPMFPTKSKLDHSEILSSEEISKCMNVISTLPPSLRQVQVVGIGGITLKNCVDVFKLGINCVAMIKELELAFESVPPYFQIVDEIINIHNITKEL
jgi:thiamine-phosphate pyrophosphorylase